MRNAGLFSDFPYMRLFPVNYFFANCAAGVLKYGDFREGVRFKDAETGRSAARIAADEDRVHVMARSGNQDFPIRKAVEYQ